LGACDVTLARGLTRHEAEAASARLNQEGIAVSTRADTQQPERFQLEVAQSAVPQAMDALAPRTHAVPDDALASRARRNLPLVPTRNAEARAREEVLNAKLRQLLRSIPGVAEVAVQTTITPARERLDDLNAAPQHPSIKLEIQLVRETDAPMLGERARALIAKSGPELEHALLTIEERALPRISNACAALTHIGPITLTAASMSTLKLWLSLSLLIHMASAAALIAVLRRSQRLRRARD
jgi:type III secretory pathway lipoprotein EscJ